MRIRSRTSRGFTLVELLVVIAIIGVLVGLLLPAVQAAREASRRTECANNIKQLGLSCTNYVSSKQVFPVGLQGPTITVPIPPRAPYTNLMVELLPFIEQANLKSLFDKTQPTGNSYGPNTGYYDNDSSTIAAQVVDNFRCPSSLMAPTSTVSNKYIFGTNDYAGNGGTRIYHPSSDPNKALAAAKKYNDGLFNIVDPGDVGIRPRQVTDGLSKTLLFGERNHEDETFDRLYPKYPLATWSGWAWTMVENSVGDFLGHSAVPINYQIPGNSTNRNNEVNDRLSAWGSYHPGGVNFCLADGSVQFVLDNMDLSVLKAISTIKGNEVQSKIVDQ